MPPIPRYETRVGEATLPPVRIDPRAPIESFGGGEAAEGGARAIRGNLSAAQEVIDQEQDRADDQRLSEKVRAHNDWEFRNIHDPKTGAKSKVGTQAFGVSAELEKTFNEFVSEQSLDLATPRQRAMYQRLVTERRAYIKNWSGDFEAGQRKSIQVAEYDAAADSARKRAATDPGAVVSGGPEPGQTTPYTKVTLADQQLAVVRQNTLDKAKALGMGVEATDRLLREQEALFHSEVIAGFGKDYAGAQAYWKKYRDTMPDGAGRAKIDQRIREGEYRNLAVEIEREVFHPSNPKDEAPTFVGDAVSRAYSELHKRGLGNDPEARAAVKQEIEEAWSLRQRSKKEVHQARVKAADDIIDRTGRVEDIPAEIWTEFSKEEKAQYRAYALEKKKKPKIETNPIAKAALRLEAAYDLEKFLSRNFLEPQYLLQLSQEDRADLMKLQAERIEGQQAAREKIDGWRNMTMKANDLIDRLEITDKKKVSTLRAAIDYFYDLKAAEHPGKPVTSQEMDDILKDLVSTAVEAKSKGLLANEGFWGHALDILTLNTQDLLWADQPHVYKFEQFETDRTSERVEMEKVVPVEKRRQIEQALRRKGIAPIPPAVLQLYRMQLEELEKKPAQRPASSQSPPMPPPPPTPPSGAGAYP